MSETRTHEATPHKLADARAQGDFALSADWISAALLAVLCVWANFGAAPLWTALGDLAREAWRGRTPSWSQAWALAWPLGLLLLGLALAALLATSLQRGFAFGFARQPRHASDARTRQRLARAFGSEARHAFVLSLLKLCVLSCVLLYALRGSLPGVVASWQRDSADLLQLLASAARSLGLRAALTLALLGLCDLLYRRWRRARRLRMSQRELQYERRDTEGDPLLLRERRARGRELLSQASLAELESAALVIVGPSRVLALRYRAGQDVAPVVWIKAQGALAVRLLAHAQALVLPVHGDAMLVEELYRLEVSQPIPETTHARVAALLVDRG